MFETIFLYFMYAVYAFLYIVLLIGIPCFFIFLLWAGVICPFINLFRKDKGKKNGKNKPPKSGGAGISFGEWYATYHDD